jgi:hypothetical protein
VTAGPTAAAATEPRSLLLAEFRSDGDLTKALIGRAFPQDAVRAGERFGFHPAFTLLVGALALDNRRDESTAFVSSLLEAVPSRADGLAAVRHWFLASWDAELRAMLAGTAALEPAAAIVALVEKSLGEDLPTAAWRVARSALARVERPEDDPLLRHADVLLAMAWDLDRTPGAAGDVVQAWASAIMHASDREQGWTAELGRELGSARDTIQERVTAAVRAEFGDQPPADSAAQQTIMNDYRARMDREFAEWPRAAELSARREALMRLAVEKRSAWLATARANLIAVAGRES